MVKLRAFATPPVAATLRHQYQYEKRRQLEQRHQEAGNENNRRQAVSTTDPEVNHAAQDGIVLRAE
ncbi:hypothetical protein D3C78_1955530 [compost metagenome]